MKAKGRKAGSLKARKKLVFAARAPSEAQSLEKICDDIKSLKVQGARNIAIKAVEAINIHSRYSQAASPEGFYGELIEAADMLASTRPTEPMLRNSIRYILAKVEKEMAVQKRQRGIGHHIISAIKGASGKALDASHVDQLRTFVGIESSNYIENMSHGIEQIAMHGARQVPHGATVLVHCHSSTVTAILKNAWKQGRLRRVFCTETRPKYQGRITAKELSDAGIDTTLIVDSAAAVFLPQCDLVLVGADAISAGGDLANKIGTCAIATLAHAHHVRLLSAAEIYKFEPVTAWGSQIVIEERDTSEVADTSQMPHVKIRNPAFDITAAKYIGGYITERGVIAPASFAAVAGQEFALERKKH